MRTRSTLAALLAAALVVLSACSSSGASGSTFHFTGAQSAPHVIAAADRKPAPDFTGSLLDGGTYDLKKDAGKVTVVNFWGTWCGPCRIETPQFGQMYQAYRSKGVAFVGIDVKEPGKDQPRAFVKQYDIRYPIVYDEVGETAVRLGDIPTQAMPFTVVLDKHHRVAGVYVVRMAPSDLEPILHTLLAES
jgi:thiol-disulfide isomerase/thioredoxin